MSEKKIDFNHPNNTDEKNVIPKTFELDLDWDSTVSFGNDIFINDYDGKTHRWTQQQLEYYFSGLEYTKVPKQFYIDQRISVERIINDVQIVDLEGFSNYLYKIEHSQKADIFVDTNFRILNQKGWFSLIRSFNKSTKDYINVKIIFKMPIPIDQIE